MGYSPRPSPNRIKKYSTNDPYSFHEYYRININSTLFVHCSTLIIRKNWFKLKQFVDNSKRPDLSRKYIIHLKYFLSMCNPNIRLLLLNLAMNYDGIKLSQNVGSKRLFIEFENINIILMSSSIELTPYNVKKLLLNYHTYVDMNIPESYIFASVIISIRELLKNDRELNADLQRRIGLEKVFDSLKPVQTDGDYSLSRNTKNDV